MIENLNIKSFKKKIVVERQTCMIKFYSESCPLCVHLAPVYQEIANEMKDLGRKISFYKIDVDKDKNISDRLDFEGVPTLFLFHDGRYSEVPYPYDNPEDLTGYRKADIIEHINERVNR
tara:strand:+ start:2169 stop:2525 length:357 start_codon:yes stop_codon:yes gene_type:complete